MSPERLLHYFERISEAPDAIPRLRRFILDLAVRGKLVPQDPDEQSVSETLFGLGVTEQAPFETPPSWLWLVLADAAHVEMGQSPPSEFYNKSNDGMPFFQGKADFGERLPTPRYWCTRPTKIASEGDILISVRAPVGPTNVASEECCIGRGLAALRPKAGLDREFLLYALKAFEPALASIGFGTTFVAITKKQLSTFPIPLPPLAEQHRIVAKVDELMALCDELEAAQAKREDRRARLVAATLHGLNNGDTEPGTDTALDFTQSARFCLNHLPRLTTRPEHVHQLRQTILNLAVRGKLVEQDPDDEPAEKLLDNIQKRRVRLISEGKLKKSKKKKPTTEQEAEFVPKTPPGWALTLLGSAYDVRDGTHDTPKYVDNGYPLVTSKNLSSGRLDFDNVKFISEADHLQISERSAVNPGDVLLAMIGSIGNPVIVDTDRPFSIKNVALFKYFDPDLSCPGFLRIFLDFATIEMKQRAAGGLQPFVSLGFLRSYPLLLPPLAEQQRIVAKVDELMALCDELEAHLTTAATTRARLVDATLHEALNGAGDTAEAAMAD